MNALVSVVVDNCVLVSTLVAVLVSIFALILWRTRKRTDGSETGVDEDLLTDDATPRAKKTAKRPKKSKAEKVCTLRCVCSDRSSGLTALVFYDFGVKVRFSAPNSYDNYRP